ncbi:MAG: hypothetical protein IPJ47_16385 [Anaerolineales bacterium]|nr:hypothetical protein [Anaerolineales bacterium]
MVLEKNTPPRIQTYVEALGIAVDVVAYISYYEVPKIRADYSGTVNLESIDAWNPTPAPIPHQNPGPSELWLEISNIQVVNSVNENIYIQKIEIGIGSKENLNFVNVFPNFSPMDVLSDFNIVPPGEGSRMFEINSSNVLPPNVEAHGNISLISETQRTGL